MSFLITEGTTHVGILKQEYGVYLRYFDETNTGFTYLTEAARQDGYVIATVPEFLKAHGIAMIKQEMREKPLAERIEQPRNKYSREIKPNVWVDVYDVLGAFTGSLTGRIKSAVDHATKKLLAAGERGHKDLRQDIKEARQSLERAEQLLDEWV